MKKLLIIFFIASIPILYLYEHNCSFRMTRQIADMEEEKKLLTEQLEQSKIEAAKAFCFPSIEAKALALNLAYPVPDSENKTNLSLTSFANQNGNKTSKCTR